MSLLHHLRGFISALFLFFLQLFFHRKKTFFPYRVHTELGYVCSVPWVSEPNPAHTVWTVNPPFPGQSLHAVAMELLVRAGWLNGFSSHCMHCSEIAWGSTHYPQSTSSKYTVNMTLENCILARLHSYIHSSIDRFTVNSCVKWVKTKRSWV